MVTTTTASETTETRNYPLEDLGDILRDHIEQSSLTWQEAADELNMTYRHLQRVRDGSYPSKAAECLEKLGYEVDLLAAVGEPEGNSNGEPAPAEANAGEGTPSEEGE